ncbi:MAG: OB-fold nucleic acid binding domain-containing protein, partial [Bdellovibrionales bacterium]
MERTWIGHAGDRVGQEICLKGWVFRYRALARTVFIVLRDCTGTVQVVASPDQVAGLGLKLDDVVGVRGRVRAEPRSKTGFEIDLLEVSLLNASAR